MTKKKTFKIYIFNNKEKKNKGKEKREKKKRGWLFALS
jgi:hypothetical protein